MSNFLTQEKAELRRASLEQDVEYNVFVSMQRGKEYEGVIEINFKVIKCENIFIDFNGKKILELWVNNKQTDISYIQENWKDGHLCISKLVQKGNNQVSIKFWNEYANDGNGLHSHTNCNNRQFVYCQNEPYHFNKVLPIFDQPDIKGSVQFTISAPKEWEVISNTFPKQQTLGNEFLPQIISQQKFENYKELYPNLFNQENKIWEFNQTQTMSTYLYCFIAGDFSYLSYNNPLAFPVEIRIYFDPELLQYAQKQQSYIFPFIYESIKFYEQFFQTPCNWGKYDMIFCPEFTVGAMEFPGCVTYSDKLLFRQDPPTPNQVTRLGVIIAHELAHFWFGDLVTMKWWDDLWLNESFADFMCFLCLSFISEKIPTQVTDAWTNMLNEKAWGYEEDSRLNTHPIAGQVPNTSAADSIFDGITYSKGAAVLKQLYYIIGHQNFSESLKDYFKEFSYKNATLKDFLLKMEQNSKGEFDMKEFNKQWIETAGLNVLNCEILQDNLKILQKGYLKEFPTLRNHRVKIGLYGDQGKLVQVLDVHIDNKEVTEVKLQNNDFEAVLLNYEDWDFVKTRFDAKSSEYFKKYFCQIDSTLTQLLILKTFSEMVEDAEYLATDFFLFVIDQGLIRKYLGNPLMLQSICNYLQQSLAYIHPTYQTEFRIKTFKHLEESLQSSQDKSDLNILMEKMIFFGRDSYSINILKNYLLNTGSAKKVTLTEQQQWRICFRISSSQMYSCQEVEAIRSLLEKKIQNDSSVEWGMAIDGMRQLQPEDFFNKFMSPSREISYYKLSYVLSGFWSELKIQYSKHQLIDKFFERIPKIMNEEPKEIGNAMVEGIPEYLSNEELIRRLELVKTQVKPDLTFHHQNLQKKILDLKRIIKIHALYKL